MALLTRRVISKSGVNSGAAYAAATATTGDTFVPGPGVFVHVKNGGGSPINAVINDPNTPTPAGYTAFDPDITVSVTNAQERMIAVPDTFADPNTGLATLICSAVTSVTIAVYQI